MWHLFYCNIFSPCLTGFRAPEAVIPKPETLPLNTESALSLCLSPKAMVGEEGDRVRTTGATLYERFGKASRKTR